MSLSNTSLNGSYGLHLRGFVVSSTIKEGKSIENNSLYVTRETMISSGTQAFKHSQSLDPNLTHDESVELLTNVLVDVEYCSTVKGMTTVRGELTVLEKGLLSDHPAQEEIIFEDAKKPSKESNVAKLK